MARIRSLKPEAFESETLALVSVYAERTFYGMSTQADDRGRLADKPAVLNGKLWAVRSEHEPHSAKDLEAELEQLESVELICRYVGCDGKRYLHLVTWDDHQRVDKPGKPRTPRCPVHQVGDECGKHGSAPCPPPPPAHKPDGPREDSRHSREGLANPPEGSRDVDSRESGTNRAPVVSEADDQAEETAEDGTQDAIVVVLADRFRDQQEQAGTQNSRESSRESREPSRLDLGPRTEDLGTTTPPSAGPDEPGGEGFLLDSPPKTQAKKPRKSKRKPDRTALDDEADVLTNGFWDRYSKTTAQSWIAIRQIVLGALKNAPEQRDNIARALDALGRAGKPITAPSLTWALGEVRQGRGLKSTGTAGHQPYANPADQSVYDEDL
jgi:hypothetical protein